MQYVKWYGMTAGLVLPFIVSAADNATAFTLEGLLAGAYQCQRVSGDDTVRNICQGSMPFQPMAEWHPTANDEFFLKLGLNVSNGLNPYTPFSEAPWAAEMKDDLKNINGRARDHLLLAAYQHQFIFAGGHPLKAVVGIIDAAEYLDKNAYANDQFTQFMNPALTNGPNVFLPSYDRGVALTWNGGQWSLHGVVMNVGANDDGHTYDFYGMQLGYESATVFGKAHYRVVLTRTSRDFINTTVMTPEYRNGVMFSFDQPVAEHLGVFVRLGKEHVAASLQHDAIYSGGINLSGETWNRAEDNIGIGYVYLHGGNTTVRYTQIVESYYRWVITEKIALSADVQYVQDSLTAGGTIHGWVYGVRGTLLF